MFTFKLFNIILCCWIFFNLVGKIAPAKILYIFPIEFKSHHRAFGPLIEELAKRGHEVTAYTPNKISKPLANYTEIIIKPDPKILSNYGISNFDVSDWKGKSIFQYMLDMWTVVPQKIDAIMAGKPMQDLILSKEKYDLVILEAFYGQEHLLAFGHKFNAPVVNLHPLFLSPLNAKHAGLPHTFSYIPDYRLPHSDRMSFLQRTKNALLGLYEIAYGHLIYLPTMEERMRRTFKYPGSDDLPPLKTLMQSVSLWLVDSHPLMSSVRPYSPNVKDIGGMSIKIPEKLPADLQKLMDDAKDGVIYCSFGSLFQSSKLTEREMSVFTQVFRTLKQKVIWKLDRDITNKPENVLTGSWFPQVEILAHPNCKLFITHGGFNSLIEAMSVGVPVIGIPIFADQFHNVIFYEEKEVGLGLSYETLTEKELKQKINKVINDQTFAINAKKISKIFHDEPETALQKAVYWTEYIIRHKGAAHLRPASLNLPYYQYLLLDVISAIVITLFIIIFVLKKTLQKIMNVLGLNSRTEKSKMKNKKND